MFVVYGGFLKWRISHDITIGIRQLFYWNPWFWDSTILENHHILIEFHHESTIKEVLDLHVEVDARSDTFAPASPHINTINCIQLHSIAIVEACEFGASKILIIRAIIPHICDMPDMRCPRCQWSFEWDNIKGTPFGQCLKKMEVSLETPLYMGWFSITASSLAQPLMTWFLDEAVYICLYPL